ncbi:hypothetical protein ENSA5_59550 [Enhygromyxa salina]|uniref:Uncharacterized protein n=1 Tax=Enhygromyxa salina TaxID=215803 RepID=A0A2S9XDR4_9BACT|nr:hypothetical protein ENSA5_59550 [Enhygromyxa salina]
MGKFPKREHRQILPRPPGPGDLGVGRVVHGRERERGAVGIEELGQATDDRVGDRPRPGVEHRNVDIADIERVVARPEILIVEGQRGRIDVMVAGREREGDGRGLEQIREHAKLVLARRLGQVAGHDDAGQQLPGRLGVARLLRDPLDDARELRGVGLDVGEHEHAEARGAGRREAEPAADPGHAVGGHGDLELALRPDRRQLDERGVGLEHGPRVDVVQLELDGELGVGRVAQREREVPHVGDPRREHAAPLDDDALGRPRGRVLRRAGPLKAKLDPARAQDPREPVLGQHAALGPVEVRGRALGLGAARQRRGDAQGQREVHRCGVHGRPPPPRPLPPPRILGRTTPTRA